MGNKQAVPSSTEVILRPRCVHRGCMNVSYGGFVMCLDHIKEAKRKHMEEDEGRAKKTRQDGSMPEQA